MGSTLWFVDYCVEHPKASTSVMRLQWLRPLFTTTLIFVVSTGTNANTRIALSLPTTLPPVTVTQLVPSNFSPRGHQYLLIRQAICDFKAVW
jgi:hypothetical protein